MSAKKYVMNFSSQLGANALSLLLSLFTTPYAARVLGPSKFGEYNLATSFAVYATLLSAFGFSVYASREVPRIEKVHSLVNVSTSLKATLSILSVIVMVGIGVSLRVSADFISVMAIVAVGVIVSAFDLRWVFIAKERLAKVSYLGLLGQCVFAILLVMMVHTSKELVTYSILLLIPLFVPAILSLIMYEASYGKLKMSFRYEKWHEMRHESLPLGLTSLTATINVYFAGLIIGLSLNTEALGYYSVDSN